MADHSVIRLVPLACLGALALSGCHKPSASNTASPAAAPSAAATGTPAGSATALPTRKAGFWVETMTRDGKTGPMGGSVKMCIDAATDAKFSTFGRQMGKSACHQQSITRGLDGSYHFATTCTIGAAGRLMELIAEKAHAEGRAIVPVCGYAAAWIARHPRPVND